MITIDYKDRRSIYEQLVDRILLLAAGGALPPGSRLPSVRQLSSELSINPNTVQRAYAELERRGIINSIVGRGNFVTEDAAQLQRSRQQSVLEAFDELVLQALAVGLTKAQLVDRVTQGGQTV